MLGWLWAVLAGPLRVRLASSAGGAVQSDAVPAFPRGHAFRFYLSLFVFYLAVGSPLDQIGERFLLSAHMLQHQLLIYPAAILFLLGLPHWMVDPLLGLPGGVDLPVVGSREPGVGGAGEDDADLCRHGPTGARAAAGGAA